MVDNYYVTICQQVPYVNVTEMTKLEHKLKHPTKHMKFSGISALIEQKPNKKDLQVMSNWTRGFNYFGAKSKLHKQKNSWDHVDTKQSYY